MSEEKYNIDEYPIEEKLEEVMKLNQEQVKIIEHLQQKVEQLEKENKKLKEENKHIFSKVNDDELLISNAMNYTEAQEYKLKYEQLENIRKEAIKYIEDKMELTKECPQDLLNILNKGSEE